MIFETQIIKSFMHSNQVMADVVARIKTQLLNTWHRIDMETHSVIARSLWGEPSGHFDDCTHKGPVMRSFDVLFVVSLKKLCNKQSSQRYLAWYDAHVVSLS